MHFPFFENIAERTLTTIHGRLDMKDLPEAYARWPRFPLVSISNDQRRPLPEANWLATVHHGLPKDLYPFSPRAQGEYLAFLGRMSVEKRPELAIAIARASGVELKMAAKVDVADEPFFRSTVQPLLDGPLVEFIGEIGDADKGQFLGNASALLFPIDWPEPFGLVMIEAMACGTPVIAWNCGSVPEVIDHGVTGFIVNSEAEAIEAVRQVGTLNRMRIRQVFERRFSAATMAKKYLELYARCMGQGRSRALQMMRA